MSEDSLDSFEAELRKRLRSEDPPSGRYLDFARSIFHLRDIEVVQFEDALNVEVRSSERRTLAGEHAGSSLVCEYTEESLSGYLRGEPRPSLSMQEPDGSAVDLRLGPAGAFEMPNPPARFRLLVQPLDGPCWATVWLD